MRYSQEQLLEILREAGEAIYDGFIILEEVESLLASLKMMLDDLIIEER